MIDQTAPSTKRRKVRAFPQAVTVTIGNSADYVHIRHSSINRHVLSELIVDVEEAYQLAKNIEKMADALLGVK